MNHSIKSYLKFLTRATNAHGIHSPFVYDLVTKCVYDKASYEAYSLLKSYNNEIALNKSKIVITDFGAGSRVFKSDERSISAIGRHAGITAKRQRLLFRLTQYFEPKSVLELGTSLGRATAALALGSPSAAIDTVEGCPNTSEVVKTLFEKFSLKNISLYNNTFESYFSEAQKTYDLIFIDGNHNKKNTLAYFDILRKRANNNTALIFDDIYWSPEMTEAWHEIIAHPEVTVSIDLFHWGIIFFRKEQQKEHFSIRM